MKRTVNVLMLLVMFVLGILAATALNLRPLLTPSQPQRRAALSTNTKVAQASTGTPAPSNTAGPTVTETFPPYTPLPSLTVSASYARRDLDDSADILLAPAFAATTSLQAGSEDVVASQLSYDFGLAGQRFGALRPDSFGGLR